MAELAEDVVKYLISKGLATAIGTDAFMSFLPDGDEVPAGAIMVTDTGGLPPLFNLPDLKRTLQIQIRERSFTDASVKAWLAFNALDEPDKRTKRLNGRNAMVKALQPPTVMSRDNGRVTFVFNISVITSRD